MDIFEMPMKLTLTNPDVSCLVYNQRNNFILHSYSTGPKSKCFTYLRVLANGILLTKERHQFIFYWAHAFPTVEQI